MNYLFVHPYDFFDGHAKWVWSREGITAGTPDPRPVQVRYFARRIACPEGGRLVLALSADTRYMLYLNGRIIARGPQKGDVAHQFYDVLDLTEDLEPGEQTLLVRVDSYAKAFPYPGGTGPSCSDMTAATLFVADGVVLDAVGGVVERLHTDADTGWFVCTDPALSFEHDPEMGTYVGFNERADFTKLPEAFFDEPDLGDAMWEPVTVVHRAHTPATAQDPFLPHRLMPRFLEPWHHSDEGFEAIRQVREGDAQPKLDAGTFFVEVPAHTRFVCILDAGVERTAYPCLTTEGGAGARVKLKYAECLTKDGVKGDRNQVEGCALKGYYDAVVVGEGRTFWSPLHWRGFRFIELTIETGDAPLTVEALRYTNAHYPIFPVVDFECSDAQLTRFWEIGIRTQQLCAHDSYEDCPYYEQLQYSGDVQVMNQFTFAVSGNTRMPLQAIRHYHWSRTAEGLTQSRYPSRVTQIIPLWSIHYLFMLHDWYRYTGDLAAIRDEVLATPAILRWFLDRKDASGLIGPLPYWNVADWSPEWLRDFDGCVPYAREAPTAINNFMVIDALEKTAGLLQLVGEAATADAFRAEAAALRPRAHDYFWKEDKGIYLDALQYPYGSQLTNAWALLIDLPDAEMQAPLAGRIHTDKDLCQAAYFGHYFVFDAWRKLGRQDLTLANFDTYRDLVDLGVTTWPEDPKMGRSECHGWSNVATYDLLRTILGFSIIEPGCRRMRVAPYLDGLDHAAGAFITPHGPLTLRFNRHAAEPFVLDVPEGVTAEFRHGDEERVLPPGKHRP